MGINDFDEDAGLVRLNRFLAQCGLGSRRKCDELIASGRIYVNGSRVVELGTKIDPLKDSVEYLGKALSAVKQLEYLAYCKPVGVMVTRSDPEGRRTIYDDLASRGRDIGHLNYVGRLDYNSEGLLLLTNDGEVIHALTHPRFKIKKVYQVRTARPITEREYHALIDGVESEGQLLRAAEIRVLDIDKDDQYWYEIDLFEGKNRQIRRMLEAVGHEVRRLKRVQFSSVRLGELKSGECRPLTLREIGALRNTGYKK